ncbi:MAG: CCA tRNA nucleotidyltransferase [Clostridium sp.]|uniref:CCA tRNA nucleotidyltransferase n=1 Tax=Clostridium sp. TaxID=1506 RepID=UPI003EE4C50D
MKEVVERKYKIDLPKDVEFVLKTLQQYGQGFVVGGAIRNHFLGIEPKDYDFTTDIEYDKLLEIFKDYSPKEIGKSFGIIQIKIDGIHYEIAKFRRDIGVSQDRREQEVEFTSKLSDDLTRRDFTFNAVAYDGENLITVCEEWISDLLTNSIRFVGEASERIKEDPLRAFRYVRFLSQKGITPSTREYYEVKNFVTENKELISNLSKERIRDEFIKILLSDKVMIGLDSLTELGLMEFIIPNIKEYKINQLNKHHNRDLIGHMFYSVQCCQPILELRLSALFHDIGKPQCFTIDEKHEGHFYNHDKVGTEITEQLLRELKFDNKTIDIVCKLVANHMNKSHRQTPKAMRKLVNNVGIDNMQLLFSLMEADIIASMPPYNFKPLDNMKIIFHEITKEEPCLKITDLKINGNDLMAKGYVGKEIGDKLKELHELVLENGAEFNKREILEKYI